MRTPEECRRMADKLEHEAGGAESELRRNAYRELASQWRRLAARYEEPAAGEAVSRDRSCPEIRSARRQLN